MKLVIFLGLMTFTVNAKISTAYPYEINEQEWILFKSEFNKHYEDKNEEMFRKKVFIHNKLRITEHNKLYEKGQKTYEMGLNHFGDLLPSEIFEMTSSSKMNNGYQNFTKMEIVTKPVKDVPSSIDWRKNKLVTLVKNMGKCFSCWAFSAVGALEGQYAKKTGNLISLSVQNLLDCSRMQVNRGCSGGWTFGAFLYVQKVGGLEGEKYYPYKANVDRCRYNRENTIAIHVEDIRSINDGNEEALKEAVGTVGPVSVSIGFTRSMHSYKSGIFYDSDCSNRATIDALIVGYGTDGSGADYWIVKTSFGTEWGDNGYIYMSRNKNNNCGIASYASYPVLDT